ncbi:MAG: winged helix-turn-helix transcriptional regulator [Solimonas sp.]
MSVTEETEETCPVRRTLDVMGDRWSFLIVRDAFDGLTRFGEFIDNLGIARNILADRLRRLTEAGILETVLPDDGGSYAQYRLTASGRALFPVLVSLRQWGEDHCFERGERHSTLVERDSGRRLPRMQPLSQDGRALEGGDTTVRKPRPAGAATR